MSPIQSNDPRSLDPYRLVGSKFGRYLIVELIGIGGMGVVYHARNEFDEHTKYALKILKPDLAFQYPEMVKNFIDEAKHTARLKHPGIVKLHHIDRDEEQNLPFFIMEWLDGITVDEELQQQQRMSLERVTALLDEICQAVHYAHEEGFVHRDLKPGNIMVVKNYQGREQVKILDFGIAKALDSTPDVVNSRVIGAPYYASPEQLQVGGRIDRRSDIYSLGVTVYQLLTGALPFDADSTGTLILQHLTEAPPPLRTLRPETNIAVEQVVQRAMMKRPQDRYSDVLEFARAFRQAAGLETGSLSLNVVNSQTGRGVANASVYLGKQHLGDTDRQGQFCVEGFNPNKYLVRVEARQYRPREEYVSIDPSEDETIEWALDPENVGELIVKTNVSDAEVLLNGEPAGWTDPAGMLRLQKVPTSVVEVEVRQKKYEPRAIETEVFQGQSSQVELELTKLPSRISLLKYAVYLIIGALVIGGAVGLYMIYPRTKEADELAASLARAQSLKDEGDAEFGRGKYPEAAALYKGASDLAPSNIEYRKSLGDALLQSGDYQKAEEAYGEAVRLNPEYAEYNYLLGEALFKGKKYKEAARAYYESVRLNPQAAVYHYKLGRAFFEMKVGGDDDYRCAEFEHRTAIQLGPDQADYHYHRGLALYELYHFKEAASEFQTALKMLPAAPDEKEKKGDIQSKYTLAAATAGYESDTPILASQSCEVK